MDEKGRQRGSHEMRGGKWVKSREGERRQDAEMNMSLAPVVGRRILLCRAVCAWCSCIGCRCPVI